MHCCWQQEEGREVNGASVRQRQRIAAFKSRGDARKEEFIVAIKLHAMSGTGMHNGEQIIAKASLTAKWTRWRW